MRFGLVYDFRNPAQWRKPWPEVYEELLQQILLRRGARLRLRLAHGAPLRGGRLYAIPGAADGRDCGAHHLARGANNAPAGWRKQSRSCAAAGPMQSVELFRATRAEVRIQLLDLSTDVVRVGINPLAETMES